MNKLLVGLIILSTISFFVQGTDVNTGTGEIKSIILNLDNCEGQNSINFSELEGDSKMSKMIAKYGPIRVCYPSNEVLDFSKYPQPLDSESNIIIVPSNCEGD